MSPRPIPLAIAICSVLYAGPVLADDKIITSYDTAEDGGHVLSFEYDGCGGECYIGGLSCNSGGGSMEFRFGDIESAIAAEVVKSEQREFKLTVAGKSFNFSAYDLTFQEMNGTWSIAGYAADDMEPFLKAIPGAKSFTAEIGTEKLDLPVTSDTTKWAKACGG